MVKYSCCSSQLNVPRAALAVLECDAAAQWAKPRPTPPTVSTAEARAAKAGAREQALAELDDADPLVRLGVLEDIIKGGDPLLRSFAFRKVLAASDDDMKAMMIRARLTEPKRQFTLQLLGCGDRERHKTDYCSQTLGARTQLPIGFQPAHGSDRVLTFSTTEPQLNRPLIIRSGTISGSRVTFQVNLRASNSYLRDCSTTMKLSATGLMEGLLECENLIFKAEFRLI